MAGGHAPAQRGGRRAAKGPARASLVAAIRQDPARQGSAYRAARPGALSSGGLSAGRDIPMISPLSSQPLVELCLRIPTWMWCSGGINRAVARAAFATDLPAAVLERRSKGGADGLLVDILEHNRGTLIDFLGEGLLAQNRIVDAEQIRARLARSGPTVGEDYIRLLDLADIEAWARAWVG
nr:asparagine synthase-related protein [Sphingomonas formosensis]